MRRAVPWLTGCLATALAMATSTMAGCGGDDAETPLDAGRDTGNADGEGGPSNLFDAGDEKGCQSTCSEDLRTVLDCEGKPAKTCADSETCAAGQCLPACEAAETNKSSIGCDYYVLNPDVVFTHVGDCFAVFVANSGSAPVTLSVDRDGTTYDPATFGYLPSGTGSAITYNPLTGGVLPPNKVAILFLAGTSTAFAKCPAGTHTAIPDDPAIHGPGMGKAFHLTSTAPVVAYDVFPYGGGNTAVTGATLLLPTSVWDTNYIGVNAYDPGTGWNVSMALVAKEDGTNVTMLAAKDIVAGGGVPFVAAGDLYTVSLQKGEVVQFSQMSELTGSPIQSNKPIGLWAGADCMFVPNPIFTCDGAHQQIPPVKALGYEYAAVRPRDRYEGRPESPPWRLLGAVDGTQLTYVPAKPTGAPDTLESGQLAEFAAGDPFVVKAQDDEHPFYMAGYMTGNEAYSPDFEDARGDPEIVNVVPPKQYLDHYTFFTDPTYPETNLVVVRVKGADGFAPVQLDCAGELTGWQPLGAQYEWTRVDLVRGNFEPQKFGSSTCDNGLHSMSSTQPFGLTVWGWGSPATGGVFNEPDQPGFYTEAVSYAYAAGQNVRPITTVVVPPVPK